MADEAAFGHYMKQGDCWEPVLAESSECFKAVINDDRVAVEQAVLKDPSLVSRSLLLLYWTTQQQNPDGNGSQDMTAAVGDDPASPAAEPTNRSAVYVKHRSLLMLASYHHSLKVIGLLLSTDADPYKRSPDGLSCFDFVDANPTLSITAPTVRALLQFGSGEQRPARGSGCTAPAKDGSASSATQAKQDVVLAVTGRDCEAGERPVARWESSESAAMQSNAGGASPRATAHKIVPSKSGIPEDMNAPEYTTDDFRMFGFKVVKCNKRFQHDWTACPFAHPTENARRRDPRVFRYCSTPCPSYKQGLCMRGDSCPFAHGVFECWLHPSRYKTQLCKDADRCKRKVCFFAHSMDELRHPTHTWEPTEEDVVACMVLPNLDTAESASSASSWLSNDSKSMRKEGVADRAWEESRSMPSSPTGRRSPSNRSGGGMNRSATGGVQLLKSALAVLPRQGSGRMGVSNADAASTWTAGRSDGSDSPVAGETTREATREAPAGLSGQDGTFNIPAFYDSRSTMPRMSNALARMIGVDGKDGGADVIQKLTSKVSLARVSSGPRVMPLLPTETAAPMMKGANRQQKMLLEQKDLLHTAASNASDEVASQLVGLATRGSGPLGRTETQPTSQGDRLGNVELDNRGAAAVEGAQNSS